MKALGQACCATTTMLPLSLHAVHFTSIFSTTFFRMKFLFSCMELLMGSVLRRGKWLVVRFCCTLLIRFLQNVCPQSGKIIRSSIKVLLKHEENMDFECTEFSQKRSKGTHESQSEDAKKNKKTASNAGKCDQHVIRLVLNKVGWDDGLHLFFEHRKANSDPKQS